MDKNIISKIEKLLKLASSAGTEAESQAAFGRASALMAKHGIEQHQLNTADDTGPGSFAFVKEYLGQSWKSERPDHYAVNNVINACLGVEVLRSRTKGSRGEVTNLTYAFIGTAEDVAFARFAFTCLSDAFRLCWGRYRERNGIGASPRAAIVNGYFSGLARGFISQWTEGRARETEAHGAAGMCYSLVLASKAVALTSHVESMAKVRKPIAPRVRTIAQDAFDAGQRDGRNVMLVSPHAHLA